jgi:hypothetical protein
MVKHLDRAVSMGTSRTPRLIAPRELEVLRRALAVCRTDAASVSHDSVAAALIVCSRCECGCDTVEFERIGDEVPALIADGLGATADGAEVGLLVFGTANAITCLEVYSFDDGPARLPTLDSIRPFSTDQ